MQVVTYKIIPDLNKNLITYSKNYRIFSTGEPLPGALRITGFSEDVDFGSADSANVIRKFRYSTNKSNWSLWYLFTEADLSNLTSLEFGDARVFFEVKYEYDDTTFDPITEPIVVTSAKFRVQSSVVNQDLYTPSVFSSSERSPAIIADRDSSFKPYELGSAVGISKELSYQTNKLFGHEVVYFKTEPDREGGDFIFKEWTIYKTLERKCIKVVVPNNIFPDNKPNFTEFGVDFEIPFEIHIDHTYFQTMFGPNSQPRKRDYLYFPLTNRMYEIQGSYLFRGFMMEPTYWKIQLTKFHPNIDMLMKADDRKFLDNIIMSSDELFGKPAEEQKKDALDKKQFSTISNKFDETRRSLHPDLSNKIQDFTFNYSPLIEYYYDMSGVRPAVVNYQVSSTSSSSDQYLTPSQPYSIYAYEGSELFGAWQNRSLNTGDSSIDSTGKLIPVKMNGPKDSHTSFGKYVVVEGYKSLALNPSMRQSLTESSPGVLQFKQSEHSVIYKAVASTDITPNMTFSALVKFNKGSQTIMILNGYDNILEKGLTVSCSLADDGAALATTVYVTINGTSYPFAVGDLAYDTWYAVLIPISAQYGQLEVNIYSFNHDPSNVKNFNGLTRTFTSASNIGTFSFVTQQNWSLLGANYSIANIRLFNTMVQDEDHEFVISQLFIRDESLLEVIDNARPRLNVPFIAINR